MKHGLVATIALVALAACSSPEDVAEATGAQEQGSGSDTAAAAKDVDDAAKAVTIEEESALYSFDYSYPAQVAAIPELKQLFDRQLAQARSELEAQAREAQAEAKDMGFPYNAYASGTEWEVVADTPRFLSLSAELYSYSGGAHPNSNARALVWDREARRALGPVDVFASPGALGDAVAEPYCEKLNRVRAERRGTPVDGDDSLFGACPAIADLTVLLGSSGGEKFDTIGLVAPPYVAGPYAEGSYEVTLPVTEPVMAALKPAYREAFATR